MVPSWASRPLHRATDALDEINRVLHLSIRGIAQMAKSAALVEALENLERDNGEALSKEAESRIERAQREAQFAQKEVDRGFPVLHAHAVVAIWGVLEAIIEDLVLAYLENEPDLLSQPAFATIRVPLAEYEQLERGERLRFLVSEYARNSKADLKLGIGRFETMLEPVRLAGGVKDEVRRDLLEHQQIRHVLVHRAGIADRKLASHCPWLDIPVGTATEITHRQYFKFLRAVEAYLIEVMVRMLVRDGVPRDEAEDRIRKRGASDA